MNSHARDLHRAAGKLGDDQALMTKHGEVQFIARPFVSFRRRAKGKGKATSGGAGEFRKEQFRRDKKAAAVARLTVKPPEPPDSPSTPQAAIRRPPPFMPHR